MNAVREVQSPTDTIKTMGAVLPRAAQYLSPEYADYAVGRGPNAGSLRFIQASAICKDYEPLWQRWAKVVDLTAISTAADLKQKAKNTVVRAWPFRVPKNATKEEFWELFAAGASGSERYLE
jgi:hypothetical protein